MGSDIINSWHNHGLIFPFSFNGFFITTLQPMIFQNATFIAMETSSWEFHVIFMAFSW